MASKPSAFPAPPKSALFDRLEAFLPKIASENEKLEAAIASGDGDRHNIEVPAPDAQEEKKQGGDSDSDEEGDVNMDSEDKPKAAPVIEMNFALGLMEEGGSDADSSDDEATEEIDLAASIVVARDPQATQVSPAKGLNLPLDAPSSAPRPLIQELN